MRQTTMIYEIRVQGHLAGDWSEWFEGLTIAHDSNGETVLAGPLRDQAALFGVLIKVRDLGLMLLSVNQPDSAGRRRFPNETV
jgi:hypothetical protein